MQMLYIWILAAVVFGVLEGITAQLVSIWFVLGAVAAAVAAACGGAVWLQGVLFVAVSLCTKPGSHITDVVDSINGYFDVAK
mgnify:FL=1